ncbi:quinol monooxygenase YgiN [Amycolatopsis bartoniae]|uniref:Antibiotic biosynthesis monooxygenase n=1 Tax=Amycolatopsis bartoniae TaxID=941986 RepID=A0A8H9IUH9_9PSEU|nr:antibiotic biosynthesis monooxygenase family protein [Amycolatopsis bartoniae]MBB2937227.1 quinol monooxygenase YgiN [Amycolatopsis bartoniae]TVT09489.1 antibiotic biosynthesis monooxygenase [Amycolatopsis bartoniae]GHF53397.1 antibiotic biosynthesis monooxygenase [Amycolatopsis bartoniae]
MTTIATDAPVVTLINVFTVQPDRQRKLVEVLARATDEVMRHVPGFVSANLHAGEDGTRVVNYAQWESVEAYRAMLQNPTAQEHMREAAALVDGFDPHLYTVESVHTSVH